jgi:methylenetetrahydrofolate dehydrogenase (NADP+) / methenyltetrahydrofolate cyclohydrolase
MACQRLIVKGQRFEYVIIDGKKIANKILTDLKVQVKSLPFTPVFCDVLVGDDPVSLSYVNIKGKAAESIGIRFELLKLPANVSQEELISKIHELNRFPNLCGLIVQLPLPGNIDRQMVLDAINPVLDVDCLGMKNLEKFYSGDQSLLPPTAAAIVEIIRHLQIDLKGKTVVIVGKGALVGRPVDFLLSGEDYVKIVADNTTRDLRDTVLKGDIVISGTGKPGLVTGDMVKENSIIIDAGTAETEGGIVGDVDFESVNGKVAWLSPVPGGVGPVTVAKLLGNVVEVAKNVK